MSAQFRRRWLRLERLESRYAPAVFTVTNNAESGVGSLTAAITSANNAIGPDTVVFDPNYFSTPRTINTTDGWEVRDDITLIGPGSGLCALTVTIGWSRSVIRTGNMRSLDVNLSGLSFRGGQDCSGIRIASDRVSVRDCNFFDFWGYYGGGQGIVQTALVSGTLSIEGCRFANASGVYPGVGISMTAAASVTIRDSSFSGFRAEGLGGAVSLGDAQSLTIENSLFAGNYASSGGGAIDVSTRFLPLNVLIRNSTFSGNSTYGSGGAIRVSSAGPPAAVRIENSTLFSNSANGSGGGVALTGVPAPNLLIESSIVSNNSAPTGPDLSAVQVQSHASAIGNTAGVTNFVDAGQNLIGALLFIGPLADNGGPTATHALLPGSPCIDAGANPADLTMDQRGRPRAYGLPDIGAFEYIPAGKPYAIAQFADITAPTSAASITVTFAGGSLIDTATIDSLDLRVIGPNGFDAFPQLVSINQPGPGTPRVATYSLAGPGGSWDAGDSGHYRVTVEAAQVSDLAGNTIPESSLGRFSVRVPMTAVVSNANDTGPGSLRQAILDTNAGLAADTIVFNLSGPATISLSSPMTIADSLTILGPGAGLLTISGGGLVRPLEISAADMAVISISGVTIADGRSVSGPGGLFIQDESVTLTDVTFAGNTAAGDGGAVASAGPLTVVRGRFRDNRSAGNGGALFATSVLGVNLTDSLFQNNFAGGRGGAVAVLPPDTAISGLAFAGCTLADNIAADGGAIASGARQFTIQQTTVTRNTATGRGGAVFLTAAKGHVTATQCTIVDNSAAGGGGFASPAFQSPSVTLNGCIVFNSAPLGPDILTLGAGLLTDTMIGTALGYFTSTNSNAVGIDPRLGPLADNGGPTPTMLPLPGSPVRDRGLTSTTTAFDQRGSGFVRLLGTRSDVGSIESTDPTGVPVALGVVETALNVLAGGGTSTSFSVTYSDDAAIDISSLGDNDIRVVGPGGFDVPAKLVSIDQSSNAPTVVARYTYTPPGGSWDGSDYGNYRHVLQAGSVFDASGHAALPGAVGLTRVTIPRTFLVTTVADSGPGSLRQAVLDANDSFLTKDTIAFDPGVFAGSQTITLTGGGLRFTEEVTVTGPGAGKLTIDAMSQSRHFTAGRLTMSGLTLTNGRAAADYGGAISATLLTLNDMTITNCVADLEGGAISATTPTMNNCTFRDNSARAGGAIQTTGYTLIDGCTFVDNSALDSGGAIKASSFNGIKINNSRFQGNSANVDSTTNSGGAITGGSSGSSNLILDGCVFAGNSAAGVGGAVYWMGNTNITNCTFAENTADYAAGAVSVSSSNSSLVIRRSLFTGNSSQTAGALSFGTTSGGTIYVENSTFTGNLAYGSAGAIRLPFLIGETNFVNIRNSTIVGNSAGNGAGGLEGSSRLESCIVAKNYGKFPDIRGGGFLSLKNSAIGSYVGIPAYTNLGGNLPAGTNLKLGPLGDHGGPTATYSLLPDSPCINAGSNPGSATTDQRGFPRSNGKTDIGAYETQPVTVTAVRINDGTVQRSRVERIVVEFSQPVTLPTDPASAFSLVRNSDSAGVKLIASVSGNSVTLQFHGGLVEYDSLADGRYTLTIRAADVLAADGPLDGNQDGKAGGDYSTQLHRLFGDANGDRKVTSDEWLALRLVLVSPNKTFDFNGDGTVDAFDILQFRLRFLKSV
ncbi:MAG: hypothetical protein K1X57_03765 [Gemmataceae bacterium]|nr:hypothetical protein [Gemmataceae bacterium]